jgi:hypothetical protein
MKKIAILGAGATAAYINAACQRFKGDKISVKVFTNKIPEPPVGAVWFRNVPNDLKSVVTAHTITIVYLGTAENYLRRQWGNIDFDKYPTSFGRRADKSPSKGYKPADVLPHLWNDAHKVIVRHKLTDDDVYRYSTRFDFVFVTFPLMYSTVRLQARSLVRIPIIEAEAPSYSQNIVIYNGTSVGYMVRISQIYGKIFVEYPTHHILEQKAVGRNAKVTTVHDLHPAMAIPTTPPDLPNNIRMIGRYAEFKRHMLAHEAYTETMTILEDLCK